MNWLIYGANGYTGRLIAAHAVERGHRPLLAGRSAEKIRPVAEELGLAWEAVELGDTAALHGLVEKVDLVLHAAGPFIHTGPPMIEACLAGETHYLDITGEIQVFEHVFGSIEQPFGLKKEALAAGIALIPGVGFDVIPTDCLAAFVGEQLPEADWLEIAFAAIGSASPGTTKTAIEFMSAGGSVRRNGRLQPLPIGEGSRTVRFSDRARTVMPIPWGDLVTGYQTTGIPNITTYAALPSRLVRLARWGRPFLPLLSAGPVKKLLQRLVDRYVSGPDAELRASGRSYIWARAGRRTGETVEAWLETAEGYQLTVWGSVLCVEKTLAAHPRGALTPALAFGTDLVLEIPGSRRLTSPV